MTTEDGMFFTASTLIKNTALNLTSTTKVALRQYKPQVLLMPSNISWKILLIEHSPDLQALTQLNISMNLDADITITNNLEEAYEVLKLERPDFIFLGLDNLEPRAVATLIEYPATDDIPVFGLTSRARLADEYELKLAGAKGLLNYAFEPYQLQALVKSLAERLGTTDEQDN